MIGHHLLLQMTMSIHQLLSYVIYQMYLVVFSMPITKKIQNYFNIKLLNNITIHHKKIFKIQQTFYYYEISQAFAHYQPAL